MTKVVQSDDQLDIAFLKEFSSFGIYNHVLTADVLTSAMQSADDKAIKILRVKLYSEFISAIEDFAGLCIAIADRESMSVVGTYLLYGTKFKGRKIVGPGLFFAATENDFSGVDSWLGLPALKKLYNRLDADTYKEFVEGYRYITDVVHQAGKWYRIKDRLAVGAYNKIKHGFVVTQGFSNEPPFFDAFSDEAAVLYSESSMAKEGKIIINGVLINTKIGIDVELEAINTLLNAGQTLIKLFLILKDLKLS